MHLKITTICLTATFQGNSKQSVPLHFFPPLVLKENLLEINDIGFFRAGCLIHPTVSNTEGNTKHWPKPVARPHPFFIHHHDGCHTPCGAWTIPWTNILNSLSIITGCISTTTDNLKTTELHVHMKVNATYTYYLSSFLNKIRCKTIASTM